MISIIIRHSNKNLFKSKSIFQLNQNRYYCSNSSGSSSNNNGLMINDLPVYYHRDLYTNKDIYLIGSIHLSKNSAFQVVKFIQDIKPDTVVLELCQERYQKLRSDIYSKNLAAYENPEIPKSPLFNSLAGGMLQGGFMDMINRFYKAFRALGLTPGLEFILAIKEADTLGSQVVCGDAPIKDTMSKVLSAMKSEMMGREDKEGLEKLGVHISPIMKALSKDNVSEEEVEEAFKKLLSNKALKEMRSVFEKELPFTYEAILIGRERSMVRAIKQSKGSTIVAVAGALHIEGIKDMLNQPLDKIPLPYPPPPKSAFNSIIQDVLSGSLNNNNNNNNNINNNNNNNNFNNFNNIDINQIKNLMGNNNFNNIINNNNIANNNNNNNMINGIKNLFDKFKPKN